MTDPYKIYEKHQPALKKFMGSMFRDAADYALTGKEPDSWRRARKRTEALEREFERRVRAIPVCPRCKKQPEVRGDIDCGIDGGPSPVTIRGIQIRCSCGMKTDIHDGYPGVEEQTKVLRRCVEEWESF